MLMGSLLCFTGVSCVLGATEGLIALGLCFLFTGAMEYAIPPEEEEKE